MLLRPAPQSDAIATELLEVITPRTNYAAIAAAENLFAALALTPSDAFSLEIAARREARWFAVRAATASARSHLEEQIGVAYPQAGFRRLELEQYPRSDPAYVHPDEQVAACTLALRAPPYLPLRTFRDGELAAERAPQAAQADPVLGVLGTLGTLPDGWRALAQLVVRPAPDDWCKGYLRLAVEHPLEYERASRSVKASSGGGSSVLVGLLAAGLTAGAAGLQVQAWYEAGEWLPLLGLGAAGLSLPGVAWLAYRAGLFGGRPIYEPRLVEEKIHAPALRAQLRLAVFAPQVCPRADVEGQLRRLLAAYRQYDLASGNGFVSRPLPLDEIARAGGLQSLQFFGSQRHVPILNTRELAGLWHLPQALSDVPLLERTAARERLPLPGTVADGYRVGVSRHQGREVPVRLLDTLLSRHHLLVGKTRRGKSSLLSHIALHLMAPPNSGEHRRGVLLVDPHSDLARSVLGTVPAARQNDVVFLDLGQEARPFGLNLLDVGMGWGKRRTVEQALLIFKREFDEFWGPRMEDVFRFALLTLYEANEARCAAEPAAGPSQQHTVLEIPALLVDGSFRKLVLQSVRDPVVRQWWRGYFDMLERKQQLEIINPVQSKIQRYAGNELARNIIGQPRTTIDPRAWVREGKIVIVDGAKSAAGEDTCALVGAAVINLAGLALAGQGTLAPAARRRLTLLADEIHTMPGADFEAYLSELAKYGANAVLATQGLGRLEALDRKETGRALRPTLFSNIDGLFVFQVSAEDARYLVHELGVLEEEDLVALASYHCYARVSIDGEKLPTFSLHLDPPLPGNPAVASALATRSQHDCGRNRIDVEEDLRLAMVRVESASSARRSGGAFDASDTGGTTRNEHRPNKKPKPAPKGPTLFDSQ